MARGVLLMKLREDDPMICIPCRVTYNGLRYFVARDGVVRPTRIIEEPVTDGRAMPTGETFRTRVYDDPVDAETAKAIRREASRQRRNRNRRDHDQAMRDVGLVKTPYGWE